MSEPAHPDMSREAVESADYQVYASVARERIDYRDPDDWPILAGALLLDCPLWTGDRDFFGTGVATWVTRNVDLHCPGQLTASGFEQGRRSPGDRRGLGGLFKR